MLPADVGVTLRAYLLAIGGSLAPMSGKVVHDPEDASRRLGGILVHDFTNQPIHRVEKLTPSGPRERAHNRYARAPVKELRIYDRYSEQACSGSDAAGAASDAFRGQRHTAVAPAVPKGPVRLPSTLVAGMLIQKTLPVYPPIARASRSRGSALAGAVAR